MSFLSPFFLIGMLAIGIPIAIHLIRKEKMPTVVFSTLRFLKKAAEKQVFFQKLRHRVLLALRIAMVVLIVLAFSRPFLKSSNSPLILGQAQSTFLLLDLSMSMHYPGVFEQAKSKALAALDDLKQGDEVGLILFHDKVSRVEELTTDHAAIRQSLQELESPSFHSSQLAPALQLADDLLRFAQFSKRNLLLISDFQGPLLKTWDTEWQLSPGHTLQTVVVGESQTQNLVVSNVVSSSNSVLAQIKNLGTTPLGQAQVSLTIDEKILDQQTLVLEEGIQGFVEFEVDLKGSVHRIEVSVDDSTFPQDNSHFSIFEQQPPTKVLSHVSGNLAQDYWLKQVLGSVNSHFELSTSNAALTPTDLQDYETLVLFQTNLDASQAQVVEAFVRQGKSVVLLPADTILGPRFNALWENFSPVELEAFQGNPRAEFFQLTDVQQRHPIFQKLGSHGIDDFSVAHFWGYWKAQTSQSGQVLMRFNNGDPLLVENAVGQGRVLVWLSPLNLAWNNLAIQPTYLPLMHELFSYLDSRPLKKAQQSVGQPIALSTALGEWAHVIPPDSPMDAQTLSLHDHSHYRTTDYPGFYQVRGEGSEAWHAFNVSSEESELVPLVLKDFLESARAPEDSPVAQNGVSENKRSEGGEVSQEFWWILLGCALLLSFAEVLLANRTYR